MKKKFIMITTMILLITLIVFAMPMMSSDVKADVADESAALMTADLTAMNGEVISIAENSAPAPAPITAGEVLWLALGASLVTIAVVCRRRLSKLYDFIVTNLRRINDGTEGTEVAGGPNKFIQHSAA